MSVRYHIDMINGSIGRFVFELLERVFDHLAFFWVCLKCMFRYRAFGRGLLFRVAVEQIYFTGVQSIMLITLIAVVSGSLLTLQSAKLLSQLGNIEGLSLLLITALVREAGPILTSIVIILRSGSAIALEIGYMNVLGEMDGLRMQGVPVIHLICMPRLIAVTTAVVCLMVFFVFAALGGGAVTMWFYNGLHPWSFFYDLAVNVQASDFHIVILKGLCFGLVIPTVCMHNGFQARGAITGVPPRVSRALVECLIYCIFLNIILSFVFQG